MTFVIGDTKHPYTTPGTIYRPVGDWTDIFSSIGSGLEDAATTILPEAIKAAPALITAIGKAKQPALPSYLNDPYGPYAPGYPGAAGGAVARPGAYPYASASRMPSWLLPVGLGAAALVLVLILKKS